MDMDPANLLRRLSETVAWCALQPFVAHACTEGDLAYVWQCEQNQAGADDPVEYGPVSVLRTPRLEPPDFYDELTEDAERSAAVETLAEARAKLLRARNAYPRGWRPSSGGGRLLLYDPDETDSSGGAMMASAGYFSCEDAPPWDTWIAFVTQDAAHAAPAPEAADRGRAWESYLLCWVPTNLVPIAETGIAHCPMGCLAWAADTSTALTRLLRAAGLL